LPLLVATMCQPIQDGTVSGSELIITEHYFQCHLIDEGDSAGGNEVTEDAQARKGVMQVSGGELNIFVLTLYIAN